MALTYLARASNAMLTCMIVICGMPRSETARNSSKLAPDGKLIGGILALKKSSSLSTGMVRGSRFIWRRTGFCPALQRHTMPPPMRRNSESEWM